MPKKLRHFCWHISAFSLKMMVLATVVLLVLVMSFVWRVSSSPLDISFAKEYIESALHDRATGNSVHMESVVLYWPDLKGALYLQLNDGQLVNSKGDVIVSVASADISFSRAGLLLARIMPKEIIIKKPILRLTRNLKGEIKIDLGQGEYDEKEADEQFELTTRIFNYLAHPGVESKTKSTLSHLEAFSIEDARLLIDDDIARQSWSLPNFNLGFNSTKKGMEGYAYLKLPDIGLEKSELHAKIMYLWGQDKVDISADFKNIDVKAISDKLPELDFLGNQNVVFDAHIETILDKNFIPDDINIEIKSKSGSVFYPDLSDDVVPYKDLALNASYHYVGKVFVLRDTRVTVRDVTVFAKADIIHDEASAKGHVKVWINRVKHEQILPLWPKILVGDSSEDWVVKKVFNGLFTDVWLGFDLLANKITLKDDSFIGPFRPSWDLDVDNVVAGFEFEDMNVDYRPPLKSAKKLYGSSSFDLNKNEISFDIKKGKLGGLNISKAKFFLDQVTVEGRGDVDVSIDLDGNIQDFMRFLSDDPINIDDDMKIDIDKVRGTANINLVMKFPARKGARLKEFDIEVDGKLRDAVFPDIIKTLDLSGKALSFNIKEGLVSMSGNAMLENRPMEFSWETFLDSKGKNYKEKIRAKITADPNIRSAMGIDLSDFIEGSLPVEVSYVSYNNGKAKADIKVDLTPALFFVEPFSFKKPSSEKARAKLVAHFKDGDIKKITDLTAKGRDFTISKSDISFKKSGADISISRGSISAFTLNETKAKLDFVFDKNDVVNIIIDADMLDAQPFMSVKEKKFEYNAPAMKVSVTANKMRTSPSEVINNATLLFDIDDKGLFNQMEMNAKVGSGDFRVRFNPDKKGKRSFRLKADDAGAFLKAFQVYNDIRGGSLVIDGQPMRGVMDRNLVGKAEISNFKVVNEPALTKILSILSLTGIGEALLGEGLDFEKLEADFNWLYRPGGSLLVLKNGRTSGNSLGLLFDGTFDNQKREVDVSGTIVPMSGLNKIIGSIPLVGDILTGGSGGVFAATYTIKGGFDNPEVFVNPLSILTPGILRRILWE